MIMIIAKIMKQSIKIGRDTSGRITVAFSYNPFISKKPRLSRVTSGAPRKNTGVSPIQMGLSIEFYPSLKAKKPSLILPCKLLKRN